MAGGLAIGSSVKSSMLIRIGVISWLLSCLAGASVTWGQIDQGLPPVAEGIEVTPREGADIDRELVFYDEGNSVVRFRSLLDGRRPVLLSFNYTDCPKLCSVQLENMTLALREVDLNLGADFLMVSISIDPNEQFVRLREAKSKYVRLYNRPDSERGWFFLKGSPENVRALADQCGIKYRYIPEQKLFSHPPVFVALSPEGKIVRYIYGLNYPSTTIKGALVEAAEGKIGSPINWLAYATGCYYYDAATGKYAPLAMGIMRVGGIITVMALLAGLVPYWLWRGRHRGEEKSETWPDGHELKGSGA